MEGFMVTCPLAPSVPHLLSSSCASPRAFGLGFLQTPPRDDALALFLAFGSANTWRQDFHLTSSVPCPAHTPGMSCWEPRERRRSGRCSQSARCLYSARNGRCDLPRPLAAPQVHRITSSAWKRTVGGI